MGIIPEGVALAYRSYAIGSYDKAKEIPAAEAIATAIFDGEEVSVVEAVKSIMEEVKKGVLIMAYYIPQHSIGQKEIAPGCTIVIVSDENVIHLYHK